MKLLAGYFRCAVCWAFSRGTKCEYCGASEKTAKNVVVRSQYIKIVVVTGIVE